MQAQTGAPSQAPAGSVPIETEELLATIGELYVQVRVLRKMLQQQQQQQASQNGVPRET